jgi:hypothetical protein
MKLLKLLPVFRQRLAEFRGQKCPVSSGLAVGKLPFRGLLGDSVGQLRRWEKREWTWAIGIFLFLAGVSCLGSFGAWLWLGLAPGLAGIMLVLARGMPVKAKHEIPRILLKAGMANYAILSWIFLNLLLGLFLALILSGLLFWGLPFLPVQKIGIFALWHLAYLFPAIFLLFLLGKTLRFYLGTYFVMPLVVLDERALFSAIRASRAALQKCHLRIAAWMLLGWGINLIPLVLFGFGLWLPFAFGTRIFPAIEGTLWVVYVYGTVWFFACLAAALWIWPLGFAMKTAAYQRVFDFREEKKNSAGVFASPAS